MDMICCVIRLGILLELGFGDFVVVFIGLELK